MGEEVGLPAVAILRRGCRGQEVGQQATVNHTMKVMIIKENSECTTESVLYLLDLQDAIRWKTVYW